MADATRAAFYLRECRPICRSGDDGLCHDRNSLYLSTGAQSGSGDNPALVVPQPVSRHTRQAAMPGMHQFVMPVCSVIHCPRSIKRRNKTALAPLDHAHPRLEIAT